MYEVHPFAKWGLDFIGPVNPPSSNGHTFILTTIDYYARWIEVETFKNYVANVVTDFLEEHIIFGMTFAFVHDNGYAFTSIFLTQWEFEN